MNGAWYSGWRHVFKLDPDREISDEVLEAVCMSGTDAIMVGGSSGLTYDNTVELMSRVRRYAVDCVLEVTSLEAAVPGFDNYLVPLVLNAQQAEWLIGRQTAALQEFGHLIPWEITVGEGYLIMNGDATAARVSGANANLSSDEAIAYIQAADRLLRLPIIYIEYSGKFGDMSLVRRASEMVSQAHVIYGGGIDGPDKAAEAARAARTVVVGNVIYDNLDAALATVQAVKAVEIGV
ncbi:putative glycerol-1-phosphate prenyltransferase [Paenibacillus cellulosilyticus]|uniref:Heptaprenylglyceryl phosphate synthase n=1 Tax=Paenibacillus cellulosilyticus TaxID=375489 RepID=A0A2V2YZ68_9BACL|nr:heptaprenylglyceryl phosphate synthase [Paenibacillus cellulosilyticus]PWW08283.1 putative glycerol-1-phosphate prenyltransferase [Paenibacillus cellulosilyticus]QKS47884.1 heptaprenylglyceryl phosphate synthase [Paenibacillus cellulosilyticus]